MLRKSRWRNRSLSADLSGIGLRVGLQRDFDALRPRCCADLCRAVALPIPSRPIRPEDEALVSLNLGFPIHRR